MRNNYFEALLLFVIALLVSLPMFATDVYASSLPYLAKTFNTSDYGIKLSLYSYMLGYAITTLFSGIYSDKYSKYKIVFFGVFLFTLASLVIPIGNSLSFLIIGRMVQGLGGGTGTVIARLILKDQIPDKTRQLKALSIVAASMAISPLVGPYLGAIMAHRFGWHSIFYCLGWSGAILLILLYNLAGKLSSESSLGKIYFSEILASYRLVLNSPKFIKPTIAISLACASEFIFVANSSFFYQDVLGLSAFIYSIILSLSLSGFLIGNYLVNHLINKMSKEQVLSLTVDICTLATIAPVIGLVYSAKFSGYILIISTIITQAGVGIIIPLTQSAVLNLNVNRNSAIVGLFFFIEFMLIGLTGYLLSLFEGKLVPMLIGISMCWIAIYLTEKRQY